MLRLVIPATEKEYQRNEGALKSRLDEIDAIHFLDGLEIFIDIQNEVMGI